MRAYVNPGNNGFAEKKKKDYVDKSGLISLINRSIDTGEKLFCISRPRRFGKSYAAQMICAYYDISCDSHSLFDDLIISEDETYDRFINQFNVINLDITNYVSNVRKSPSASFEDIPDMIERSIIRELTAMYPDIKESDSLNDYLLELVEITKAKIIFVIDEWDSIIREAVNNSDAQEKYLNLLRGWFKNNNFTPQVVAAAYMTGILPIKKDGTQSAISDFQEYTMLEPQGFAGYVGFNEDEVRNCCAEKEIDFEKMKKWYDGYTVGEIHSIYNPYSVIQTIKQGKFRSYWKKTTAAETLLTYIDMDEEGLQEDIARLIAGESIEIDTDSFQNDVETFTSKDDVLTLMIHLGYLTYEEDDTYDDGKPVGMVHIPNEEVRTEFEKILRKSKHRKLIDLIKKSDQLLEDTINCNEDAVAKAIQDVHDSEYSPTFYNDEQSLRYVVKLAYLSCVDQYAKIEEMPSGRGIADVVFIPRRASKLPPMVIELKWNKSESNAMEQIHSKKYYNTLLAFGGEVLLVGINYDTVTKIHTCNIEMLKVRG